MDEGTRSRSQPVLASNGQTGAEPSAAALTVETAAIRIGEAVFALPRPNRHHNVMWWLHVLGITSGQMHDQGFVLSDGSYASRRFAAKLALENGQVAALHAPPDLYSEDLWNGGFDLPRMEAIKALASPTPEHGGREAPGGTKPVPSPPWAIGSRDNGNAKRYGWLAYFGGRGREACPFPPASNELQRAYREGWDAAQLSASLGGGEGSSSSTEHLSASPTRPEPQHSAGFRCKARYSSGPDPQDCDWPQCGCDPTATRVLESIEASGFHIVPQYPGRRDIERLAGAMGYTVEEMVETYALFIETLCFPPDTPNPAESGLSERVRSTSAREAPDDKKTISPPRLRVGEAKSEGTGDH